MDGGKWAIWSAVHLWRRRLAKKLGKKLEGMENWLRRLGQANHTGKGNGLKRRNYPNSRKWDLPNGAHNLIMR